MNVMLAMAGTGTLSDNPGYEQSLKKVKQQGAGAVQFWGKADWTEEEKAKTLAPANQARDKILEDYRLETKARKKWSVWSKITRKRNEALSTTKIEELDFGMLQDRMKEELNVAEKLGSQSATKNSTGDKAISFLSDFVQFAGEFSGILEIMKGVDQGYGGAGYAALSGLLSVVVNTKRNDDLVAEAMLDLKNEYSRMVLVSELYPTQKIRSYITTTYTLGIEFLQEAQKHYERPTWRRFLYSIVKPPFLLNRKVKEISSAMAQISKEQNSLLNKRVHEIQTQLGQVDTKVDDVSQDVQRVKIDVNVLHANREKERLFILISELSEYQIQPDQTVSDYSALLSSSFKRPPGLAQFSLDMLTRDKAYQLWNTSKGNCCLVLNGRTTAAQTSFCWLSPASMGLASALREEARHRVDVSRVAVAEIYCQKKDLMPGNVKQKSVIVSLILQLLEADPTVLRDVDQFERLHNRLNKPFSDVDQILKLLVETMLSFDTVYVVIDRVDRISGDFMQMFLQNVIARHTSTKVRAFFVAARNDDIVAKIADLEEEMDEKKFIPLHMDQQRTGR
ncbi:hypothetical protein HD806DRAFT_84955 [Xylariaceae sp. AK1471]|nr:hypothetical protein HD806DRAFT_84955 [Xylariaceae sp. AK1471]